MKVSRLVSRGVASLPDIECDFMSATTGRPHDLIVISGPPASGKTRLCELMLAAFEAAGGYQGIVQSSDWVQDANREARVELELWLDEGLEQEGAGPGVGKTARAVVQFGQKRLGVEVDRAVSRRLARYDHDPAHGKREYFAEGRQRAWGAREDGTSAVEQALVRCSKDPQKYSCVPRFLAELRQDPARSRSFAQGVELLSPTLRHKPASRTGDATACFINQSGNVLRFAELSSSEADAVIIAATAAMIGLNHSIIFLDRPELYVPSDRLVAWVQSLARLGENNQWFVATNDEALAASVQRSQHISLGRGEDLARPSTRPSWSPS